MNTSLGTFSAKYVSADILDIDPCNVYDILTNLGKNNNSCNALVTAKPVFAAETLKATQNIAVTNTNIEDTKSNDAERNALTVNKIYSKAKNKVPCDLHQLNFCCNGQIFPEHCIIECGIGLRVYLTSVQT